MYNRDVWFVSELTRLQHQIRHLQRWHFSLWVGQWCWTLLWYARYSGERHCTFSFVERDGPQTPRVKLDMLVWKVVERKWTTDFLGRAAKAEQVFESNCRCLVVSCCVLPDGQPSPKTNNIWSVSSTLTCALVTFVYLFEDVAGEVGWCHTTATWHVHCAWIEHGRHW